MKVVTISIIIIIQKFNINSPINNINNNYKIIQLKIMKVKNQKMKKKMMKIQ